MECPAAVGNKYQVVRDCGGPHHVLLQGIRPDQAVRGDVAGSGRVNALEPSLILAPPDVPTARGVHAALVENGHAVEVTGAFPPVAVVLVDVGLGRARVEIELPDFLQRGGMNLRIIGLMD